MVYKEALFYKKLKEGKRVQCQLCPHFCVIDNGEVGKCKVRQNMAGRLKTLVYAKPCSVAFDPIEKKPLYHFLPGQRALSVATPGCNFSCKNCQNADISQQEPEQVPHLNVTPLQLIKDAKKADAKIISYTYTEPTIFYEYMIDIAKIAKKEKIKNMTVTNGFINPKPLKELCKLLDGSNIDLKSMSPAFYEKICGGRLEPVLEAVKLMHKRGVWIELTNLIIPELNDSLYEIRKLVSWVLGELGPDVPLHFSAFYPTYKLTNYPRTDIEILKKARKIAMDAGINYVYTGNIIYDEGENTYCPRCRKPVIIRKGFQVIQNKLKDGKCPCGEKIPGVWR